MHGPSLLLAVLLVAPAASALEFAVTRTDDPQPPGTCDPGDCSLREAILAANARAGPDVVALADGDYDVNGPGAYEDAALFGDLDVTDDLTIQGVGADTTAIRVVAPFTGPIKVFHIDPGQSGISVEIADVTIASPFDTRPLAEPARCILNDGTLLLNRVVLRDCTDGGPAIYNAFGATLTVLESTVRDNVTTACGGGIASSGSLTIVASTISGNQAACGGGVSADTLNVTNSTIRGNSAVEAGGGISTLGPARIANVTLTENTTDSTLSQTGGGGIFAFGTVEVSNSIVAGNADLGGMTPDCGGGFASLGHNLLGDASGCAVTPAAGDQIGTGVLPIDPMLGSFGDHGGPTETYLLAEGSPAIDGGDPAGCTWDDDSDGGTPEVVLATDPRGEPRPGSGSSICDVGAVEVAPEPDAAAAGLAALWALALSVPLGARGRFDGPGVDSHARIAVSR